MKTKFLNMAMLCLFLAGCASNSESKRSESVKTDTKIMHQDSKTDSNKQTNANAKSECLDLRLDEDLNEFILVNCEIPKSDTESKIDSKENSKVEISKDEIKDLIKSKDNDTDYINENLEIQSPKDSFRDLKSFEKESL